MRQIALLRALCLARLSTIETGSGLPITDLNKIHMHCLNWLIYRLRSVASYDSIMALMLTYRFLFVL